jgi:hypothetical protein
MARSPAPAALAHLALALPLWAACAHKPPPLPPDPCASLDDASSPVRRKYAGPDWLVGVGHATGLMSPDEQRRQAEASAAAGISAQLVVRVQSSLEVNETSSSLAGASSRVDARTRAEVVASDLPGLRVVEACRSPSGFNTTVLSVLNRAEAREALARMLQDDGAALAAGTDRLKGLVAARAVVSAVAPSRQLAESARRWRANARIAQALGAQPPPSDPAGAVDALAAELAAARLGHVERTGAAGDATYAVLDEAAGSAVTAAGWRLDDASRANLRVRLGVSGCGAQPIPALSGVKVSCVLDVQLVEAARGDVLRSLQVPFEGVGRQERQASADAARKAAGALRKPLEAAITALEAESAGKQP